MNHIQDYQEDESFSDVAKLDYPKEGCERITDSAVDSYLENRRHDISLKTNLRQITNCVVESLKSDKFFTGKILLAEVLEHTKLSWKIWKYFERNNRLNEVKQNIERSEIIATSYCQGEDTASGKSDDRTTTSTKTSTTTSTTTSTHTYDLEEEGSGDQDYKESTTTVVNVAEKKDGDSSDESDDYPSVDLIKPEDGSGAGNYDDEDDEYRRRRQAPSRLFKRSIHYDDEDLIFET